MNQSGKAARESAWNIAVESWLQSKGFIKVHIPQKGHQIFPLFLLMNSSGQPDENYLTEISSISEMRVLFGGIAPSPRSP
jgi:hypothetical protein